MKIITATTILISALVLTACGDDKAVSSGSAEKKSAQETALEHSKKHLDAKYVCPMHPQIVRDQPGSCPICGMDLVEKEADDGAPAEQKILYYKHPHNPTITSDKPMKDEMGMDYVPVYDDGGGVSVKISPAVENNMGVRTAKVERDKLWKKIDTVGYVDFDENRISHIHLRTKGWIEKLYVKSEGERVSKGDLLFEVYAPELVNAQEEYVQALRSNHRGLIGASRERLEALGISDIQINELNKSRRVSQYVKVYAQQDGIIGMLKVREGMFVMPQQEVMSLVDLSSVWLLAEVFESQAEWVKEGQPADVTLSYLPGRTWEGKVEFIYPSLNAKTRTLKVRLRFDNPDEALKPNMFADVTIYGGPKSNILIVPSEAVIRSGRENRVIIANGDGSFSPRMVTMGIESGNWIELADGVREGETIVTSGQFLIDSEASLKASLKRMTSPDATMDHSKMEMEKKIIGTGVLREVLVDDAKVNMAHDPIPALGWPDMVMYFKVKPGVDLSGFSPDDNVEFELEQGSDGYIIKSLKKSQ